MVQTKPARIKLALEKLIANPDGLKWIKIWWEARSHLSLVQDKNSVVVGNGVDPVRNGEYCAPCKRLPDCILNHGVRLHIHRCRGFIEKKDFVLPEKISIACVQICRKICGLGCVTRALVHA